MRFTLLLLLLIAVVLSACEKTREGLRADLGLQREQSAPLPRPRVEAPTPPPAAPTERRVTDHSVRDTFPGTTKKARGSWHAFARPKFNGRVKGRPPQVLQLAKDFERDRSRYFRRGPARSILLRIGQTINSKLVTDYASVARLLEESVKNPRNARVIPCRQVVGTGLAELLAIDDPGNIRWTERECDPDELIVQIRSMDGAWVSWFSLKCLNPMNGKWQKTTIIELPSRPQARVAAAVCPQEHVIPRGSPTNAETVFLFLTPKEAVCIPEAWTCESGECDDWMAGRRGPVPREVSAKHRAGGRAYMVKAGTPPILSFPKGARPWFCDRRTHGPFDAAPLPRKST